MENKGCIFAVRKKGKKIDYYLVHRWMRIYIIKKFIDTIEEKMTTRLIVRLTDTNNKLET